MTYGMPNMLNLFSCVCRSDIRCTLVTLYVVLEFSCVILIQVSSQIKQIYQLSLGTPKRGHMGQCPSCPFPGGQGSPESFAISKMISLHKQCYYVENFYNLKRLSGIAIPFEQETFCRDHLINGSKIEISEYFRDLRATRNGVLVTPLESPPALLTFGSLWHSYSCLWICSLP